MANENDDMENVDSSDDDWAAALSEQQDTEDGSAAGDEELADENLAGDDFINNPKLDVILDIPVSLSMEVGRTKIPIRNLLQLNQGSVVELDRVAGEPLDVMVNGTLIAHGEVVVVNEKFGIRLTDVMSPHERIRKLT
jgi:flagellar motor switch protein FliN